MKTPEEHNPWGPWLDRRSRPHCSGRASLDQHLSRLCSLFCSLLPYYMGRTSFHMQPAQQAAARPSTARPSARPPAPVAGFGGRLGLPFCFGAARRRRPVRAPRRVAPSQPFNARRTAAALHCIICTSCPALNALPPRLPAKRPRRGAAATESSCSKRVGATVFLVGVRVRMRMRMYVDVDVWAPPRAVPCRTVSRRPLVPRERALYD